MNLSTARRALPGHLVLSSLAILAAALLWWGVVFLQVALNTGFPLSRALPCLLYVSDRCSLAMALCGDWHILGIDRYFAQLWWLGSALGLAALAQSAWRQGPRQSEKEN